MLLRVADEFVPLKRGAGVGFIGLDVVMADEAAMGFELVARKF